MLTGAPGAGKSAILAELGHRGYAVVAETVTDLITLAQADGHDSPWSMTGFMDTVVAEQRRRQEEQVNSGTAVQFYDRSPICTLALAVYGGHPVTDLLAAEVERVVRRRVYERRVFFVRPLGFVTRTAVRRITLAKSLEFERIHEQVYRAHGYDLVDIPRDEIAARAAVVDRYVQSWSETADSRADNQLSGPY